MRTRAVLLFLAVAAVAAWLAARRPAGPPTRWELAESWLSDPSASDALEGEAVLTVGGPLLAWRHGHIDGVVSAGPHECMPNKIAESQFFHLAEDEGLPSLTLPLNGDPADPAVLDNFAFEVHARYQRKRAANHPAGHGMRAPVMAETRDRRVV